MRMAKEARCELYFPYPDDQVVLLRTGVLLHFNKYMQSLGLLSTTSAANDIGLLTDPQPQTMPTSSKAAMDAKATNDRALADAGLPAMEVEEGKGTDTAPHSPNEPAAPDTGESESLKEAARGDEGGAGTAKTGLGLAKERLLRAQWEAWQAEIKALRPVERYKVAAVAYRHDLLDGSQAGDCALGGRSTLNGDGWYDD